MPVVEQCSLCKFYKPGTDPVAGKCVRYPPVANTIPIPQFSEDAIKSYTTWAVVKWNDWCGEFNKP